MDENLTKYASRIIVVIILFFILLFLLTFTGTVKCNALPYWCDIYYSVKGKPKIAIIYGDDGLGDPELLQKALLDRQKLALGTQVTALHLNNVDPGNLKQFALVIVTRAKTMSTQKMKMFIDYALQGGNLVWTADAGILLEREGIEKGDFLYTDEDPNSDSTEHKLINPWARKLEGKVVLLNKLIGVNYEGTYCEIVNCISNNSYDAGILNPLDREHKLVRGISPSLQLKIIGNKDFAIVSSNSGSATTNVLVLETLANIIRDNINYGKSFPFIVMAGKSQLLGYNISENVAYYAMPLEYFVNPELPENNRYYSFLENLYFGLIYGS